MRAKVCVASGFVLGVLAFCAMLMAESSPKVQDESIYLNEQFYVEEITDDKLDDMKRIVQLKILAKEGYSDISWDEVVILPVPSMKKTKLNANHFSVREGTITDVVVEKNHFSFRIHFSALFASERSLQITVEKKEGQTKYSLQGVGLHWSDLLKGTTKVEYRSKNEGFILPYKDVF